jgi:hypothetical protein
MFRGAALVFALSAGACGDEPNEPADQQPAPDEAGPPKVGGCDLFPIDDPWNTPIDDAPVDEAFTAQLSRSVKGAVLHPVFGRDPDDPEIEYGLPFNVVPRGQPSVDVVLNYRPNDPGPYPFPSPDNLDVKIDPDLGYLIVLQAETCLLAEASECAYDTQWTCGFGAKFDLKQKSHVQRKKHWPSAEPSGLPILQGLVRYEEAAAGEIRHALRFTADCLSQEFVAPAVNGEKKGECDDADRLPLGLRARLKADYDVRALKGTALAVAVALKKYGMILSASGDDLYLEGERERRWDNENVQVLKTIPASAFEVVGPVMPEL